MSKKVAWIVEGYGQNGGNYTNNTIARLLDKEFDYEPRMVYQKYIKVAKGSVLPLHDDYQLVDISNLFGNVDKDDVLISNPSLSRTFIGARVPCKTIMYAQGFSTYEILDSFFTHYVAVSDFVNMQLKSIYNIDSHVIPPFIDFTSFPESQPFDQKKNEVLIYSKYSHSYFQMMYNKVSRKLKAHNIPYTVMKNREKIPQFNLYEKLNEYKYVMFLSIAEGFGLVPLETMYMGGISTGFDGFGGRHFMRNGVNSINVPYPDIQLLSDQLVDLYNDTSGRAEAISKMGAATALEYGKQRFLDSWRSYLKSIL